MIGLKLIFLIGVIYKKNDLILLKSAILNKQLVQFTYYNSNGEESKEEL